MLLEEIIFRSNFRFQFAMFSESLISKQRSFVLNFIGNNACFNYLVAMMLIDKKLILEFFFETN